MVAEKILAICLVISSGGTILASVGLDQAGQQGIIAWVGILSTAGLALLNLYQKLRQVRRTELVEDLKVTATSDRARATELQARVQDLEHQLQASQTEARTWQTLYQSEHPKNTPQHGASPAGPHS